MRLLFINQYFPPDASATAHLLGELTEDLSPYHEVLVVAGNPSYNPEAGAAQPQHVKVLHTWSFGFSRGSSLGRILNYASFLCGATIRAICVARPGLVVTMTDPPIVGLVGWAASLRHRCPLVCIQQDVFPDIAVGLGKLDNLLLARLWRSLNRLVRHRAVKVVVVARDMGAKLRSDGLAEDKIVYLPNWATPQAMDAQTVDETRRVNGWTSRFIVMHAGNVGIAQNLSIVVEAANRMRHDQDVLFVFMGDGAMKKRLQEEVGRLQLDSVVFLPYKLKHEAQALMAAADVHLVSLAPGLIGCASPSKLYGALATGRPVIAAVESGSEAALTLEEFRCGILVEPNALSLADGIARMKESQEVERTEMGERGRKALEERFSRLFITAQYKTLIDNLEMR